MNVDADQYEMTDLSLAGAILAARRGWFIARRHLDHLRVKLPRREGEGVAA